MSRRVVVSGVLGFTGKHLVPRLLSEGYEVFGLAHQRGAETPIDGVSRLYRVNLADCDALASVIAEICPDKVIHLAGVAFVAHSDVADIYQSNLLGSRNLLEALAQSPSKPSSIVLASSANIYGNKREGVLDEDLLPDPISDYAISKLAMEYVARLYADRLPITIVRPFNYTGVGQSINFVIPKIIDHVRRGVSGIELGNLDVTRDFSDVRSVVDAYARLLTCPGAVGRTFNICSGHGYSLRQILEIAEDVSGRRLDVSINPKFVRANEVRVLYGSNARLVEAIGPLQMPPLTETLRWMLDAA